MSSLLSDIVEHCLNNGMVYTVLCTGLATAVVGMLVQIGVSWVSKGYHNTLDKTSSSHNTRLVGNGSVKTGTKHEVVEVSVQTSDLDRDKDKEIQQLLHQVDKLTKELKTSEERIVRLKEEENKLRDRLIDQVQSKIDKGSTKFEDLSLGENRPTALVQRYRDLYSEIRLEVMDQLDQMDELESCDELKQKLLFSIVVLCFRRAQQSLEQLTFDVREVLQRQIRAAAMSSSLNAVIEKLLSDVDATCLVFLRRNVDKYDLTSDLKDVSTQLWTSLDEYPCLKTSKELQRYIKDCLRLSWALAVQTENYELYHDEKEAFRSDRHSRFHTSDPISTTVKSILWPGLLEGSTGICVCKAVVVT